jgi:hypothetical protein
MSAQAASYSPGPPGHTPRVFPAKAAMCYLRNGPGHFIMDCPKLPSDVRREAIENREAFYKQSPMGVPTPGVFPGQSDQVEQSEEDLEEGKLEIDEGTECPSHTIKLQ